MTFNFSRHNKLTDIAFACRTDVGCVREHNEDSLLATPPLFAVCDGMGGHEAGEVASEIAVNVLSQRAPDTPNVAALGQAVKDANAAIQDAVAQGKGREGMGTTCTAAMIDGSTVMIAQVGDSRAYLLHNRNLTQLTRDHSLVADLIDSGEITAAEARTHPWRSYITRALGIEPTVQTDLYEIEAAEGDTLLLCSDGLYTMIDDDQIASILGRHPEPQRAADELVEAAIEAGGTDNVTVIVVKIPNVIERKLRKRSHRKAKITAATIIILLALIIGGSVWGAYSWASSSAYLGVVDGKVAVYSGIPGDIAGFKISELQAVTDVSVDDLQPGVASRLEKGEVRLDNLAAAWALVEDYQSQIKESDTQ
jgi:protein phosphatase